MGTTIVRSPWLLIFLSTLPLLAQEPSGLPGPTISDGFGVNIHFTEAEPGELKALAESGNRFVRMDLAWQGVEREKGKYDFSRYDRLVEDMGRLNIRILFILDYAHRFYDEGLPPHTEEGRLAFARFAAATAERYAGKGIIWEIWNEPNIKQFWKPQPNAMDYCKLAHVTIDAIREVDPKAFIIGPASSTFPWEFLDVMGEQRVLKRLDAVSVHPYRQTMPETAEQDYARLRLLLHKYVPDRRIPIVSGEWGYSTAWRGMTEEKQAQYIVRQRLINLACDVPLSIWYDWRDDGLDPNEPEHHFGTVYRDFRPKPSYLAARQLSRSLAGSHFVCRIATGDPRDWVLLFRRGRDDAVAAWTTGDSRQVTLRGQAIQLDGTPRFHPLPEAEDLARCGPMRNQEVVYAGSEHVLEMTIDNRGGQPKSGMLVLYTTEETLARVAVKMGQDAVQSVRVPITLRRRDQREVNAAVAVSGTDTDRRSGAALVKLLVANHLELSVPPPIGKYATAVLVNASGAPYDLTLRLSGPDIKESAGQLVSRGRNHAVMHFDMKTGVADTRGLYVTGFDGDGRVVLRTQSLRWAREPRVAVDGKWRTVLDGDKNVAAHANPFVVTAGKDELIPQLGLVRHVELHYQFAEGWRFAMLQPPKDQREISGKPKVLGMWVHGDGSRNMLRCRFVDATGQMFQPDYGLIDWTGWKWVTIPLDGVNAGHWGGADDGTIHYPIRWDSMALVDNMNVKLGHPLSLRFAGFAVGYE